MSQYPPSRAVPPIGALEFALPELPYPQEHDEWLLDEALAETFPASDPIAISMYRPDRPL